MTQPTVVLSDDGYTMTVTLDEYVATYGRSTDAGPFTDADIAYAAAKTPGIVADRRARAASDTSTVRRFHLPKDRTLWVHVNTGPPTWWTPRASLRHGKIMVGWLRALVAVKITGPDEGAPRW